MLALYAALACVSAATLMYEIALTRLLSVVAWYYLAFVAISTAMLGLTAGALFVQLRPRLFPPEKVLERMGSACAGMGALLPACLVILLAVPIGISHSAQTFFSFLIFCGIGAVPFALSGVVICLGLTQGGPRIGRLYAADLGGAALGSVAGVLLLQAVDACSAVFVIAGLLLAAAAGLASAAGQAKQRHRLLAAALGLVAAGALNAQTAHGVQPIWAKDRLDDRTDIAFERWNAISRVRVGRSEMGPPHLWGPSPLTPPIVLERSELTIDNDASTVIQRFDGRPESVRHLAYDVTSIGALLRAGSPRRRDHRSRRRPRRAQRVGRRLPPHRRARGEPARARRAARSGCATTRTCTGCRASSSTRRRRAAGSRRPTAASTCCRRRWSTPGRRPRPAP